MKSKFTSFAATAALLVSGTIALAGSPMPIPPFTLALFPQGVDAKGLLKTEAAVNKLINKALAGGAKCYQKGMGNLFGGKSDGTQACLGGLTTGSGVIGGVLGGLAKIEAKAPAGSTTCITTGLAAQIGNLTGLIPSLLPVAFCDGMALANSSPLVAKICTSEPDGLTINGAKNCTNDLQCGSGVCAGADYGALSVIPTNKDTLKTENAAVGIASKYGSAVAGCVDKAVAAATKANSAAGPDADPSACILAAKSKAISSITSLASKTLNSPACLLGPANVAQIKTVVQDLGDTILGIGDVIYCN